jgi:hypothetical protein
LYTNRLIALLTRLRLAATTALPVLTLVGLDQLIPVYPTLEAALAGNLAPRQAH